MNTPLSEQIKLLIFKLVKSPEEKGEILLGRKITFTVSYDEFACEEVLQALCIRRASVLKYLEKKYVPTFKENGAVFLKQKCIQSVKILGDDSLFIHIKNSEPHKIITDSMHVIGILKDAGFIFDTNKITFKIDNLKIIKEDVMLYNACLKEWGKSVPYSARMTERFIKFKYRKFEQVAAIKKNSIQKKFLRYYVKTGQLNWEEAKFISHNRNFKRAAIYQLCKFVRELHAQNNHS